MRELQTTTGLLQNYAEDATVIEEPLQRKRSNFIEANTKEVDLYQLKTECVVPTFARDNELTISHNNFIETVCEAVNTFFTAEQITAPDIRVSHVIKGRIPEAVHKPANQLLPHERTQYYERMMFCLEIPSITQDIDGSPLHLTIGGVRAYNHQNLYSKKTFERFQLFIGFKNKICTNLCVNTDGLKEDLRVMSTGEIKKAALELFGQYNAKQHLQLMQSLTNHYLTESQFCQLIGKARLYQCLSQHRQKQYPRMLLTDGQINQVARDYINDLNFGASGNELSLWRFYNLLTGANKSSYIDSFTQRALNATELAEGVKCALQGNDFYKWYIE